METLPVWFLVDYHDLSFVSFGSCPAVHMLQMNKKNNISSEKAYPHILNFVGH